MSRAFRGIRFCKLMRPLTPHRGRSWPHQWPLKNAICSSGKTTYELAEQYGCARHTIVTALKKVGITATKAKAQEAIDADNVIRLYNEYHTIEEIAKKHGVSSNAINRCLRYNGVAIRGRWDYPKK